MRITILLADSHSFFRECVRSVLEKSAGLEVVAEAATGEDAVRLARELSPDVVIMDIGIKELNGIEATRRIVAGSPDAKVLILSIHTENRYVAASLRAGAKGYLLKSCLSAELVDAVRSVSRNGIFLSAESRAQLATEYQTVRPAAALSMPSLTGREREVLVMLAEGKKCKEIASALQISAKTVDTHRMHIMKKLHLTNIPELTKYALREGLLVSD